MIELSKELDMLMKGVSFKNALKIYTYAKSDIDNNSISFAVIHEEIVAYRRKMAGGNRTPEDESMN